MAAVEQLLALRPQAVPNSLVLLHALNLALPSDQAVAILQKIYQHPKVLQNRANNPERK